MEKVGNVQLNYEYYSGTDDYSDGAIELELLDYVRAPAFRIKTPAHA